MKPSRPRQFVDETELERIDIAKKYLETANDMELQGLKGFLSTTLKNPLIPADAKHHAEKAFEYACALETDLEWRLRQLKRWARARKVKLKFETPDSTDIVQAYRSNGNSEPVEVPVPEYLLRSPSNIRRSLNYEVAQIGMIAGELVYKDVVAHRTRMEIDINANTEGLDESDND